MKRAHNRKSEKETDWRRVKHNGKERAKTQTGGRRECMETERGKKIKNNERERETPALCRKDRRFAPADITPVRVC